jgi:hypothetical protein
MPTRILAIDPGASGGVVELYPDGRVIATAMPDNPDLRDLVLAFAQNARTEGHDVVCYMEIVGGFVRGKDGKNVGMGPAMFNFGDGFGYIRGLVDMALIERRMVLPKQWQASIPGIQGIEKAQRKRVLKEHAARLFPSLKVTLKTADALCIADHARRQVAAMQFAA